VYLGFGSMPAQPNAGHVLVAAARAAGRRALLSEGWGRLSLADDRADCMSIGDVNHERLFPRVAAVLHHGGAGTTVSAARASRPQIIVPQGYDQFYWAHRVETLGIGVVSPHASTLMPDTLAGALRKALAPEVAAHAREVSGRIELHGARRAAERLLELASGPPTATR